MNTSKRFAARNCLLTKLLLRSWRLQITSHVLACAIFGWGEIKNSFSETACIDSNENVTNKDWFESKSKKMRWKEDIKWSIEPKFFITSKKVLFGADLAGVPDNKVGTPCPLIIVTAKHSLSLFPLGTDTKSSPVVETHPSIPTTEHSVHNTKWSVNNMKIWNLSSIFICVVFKSGPVGPRSAICKVRRVFLIFKMTLFLVRAVGQSREQRGICLASSLSLQHK